VVFVTTISKGKAMDWTSTLKTLAPTVATALLGPLAGAAVTAIGSIFGVPNATAESITKIFKDGQVTPEQLSEIRKLEMQYQNDEKERGFKYADLEFKDVASARQRDTAFTENGRRNHRADVMFIMAVVIISAMVWVIWKDQSINEYVKGIFTLVLGRFMGYLDNIYNFEFGSTRTSKAKDATIENLTR
jgi:hypothetical protein